MNSIHACFQGRIGQDATLRHVKGGELPLLSFSVAVGEKDEPTEWVRVALFGDTAEELAHRLLKGTQVYVEGRISLNTWQDREGQTHSGLQVAAWTVQPLGQIGKKKPRKPRKPGHPWKPKLENVPSEAELEDEIPF